MAIRLSHNLCGSLKNPRSMDLSPIQAWIFLRNPRIFRKILELPLQKTKQVLDSADLQNLGGKSNQKSLLKFLLLFAFAKSRVPLNFTDSNSPSKADFAESTLDSAPSKQEANSSIADEFLGFCEASEDDRTLSHLRKRDEAIPKKSLRKAII